MRFVDSAELLHLQMHDRLREPEYMEMIKKAVEEQADDFAGIDIDK